MSAEKLKEVQTGSELIFDGKILHLYRDDIRLPDGNPAEREVVRHVGAVCVIPVLDDGRVVMERQYRYPVDRVILEIPAGKLDSKDEDRLSAAKRELQEETGYTAEEWTDLGDYYPAAAYTDERISLYLAKGLKQGDRNLDEDEFLDVVAVDLEELVEDVLNGTITDGKTQAALLKAYLRLK